SIALDAAHIRWHQAGGPETEDNGLALCVLHHKTFDLGAFTVADGVLLVSDQANGTTGLQETLLAYHGKAIRDPHHPDWPPQPRPHGRARPEGVQGRGAASGVSAVSRPGRSEGARQRGRGPLDEPWSRMDER